MGPLAWSCFGFMIGDWISYSGSGLGIVFVSKLDRLVSII